MSPAVATGILCGVLLGLGLWSLVALAPRLGRPRLTQRTAPYLLDISAEAREIVARRTVDPLPVFGVLLAPLAHRVGAALGVILGGNAATARRLRQVGRSTTVAQFRVEQLTWAAAGLAFGGVIALALPVSALPSLRLSLPALAAVTATVLRDLVLQRAARRRADRITSELPTVVEFLSLGLAAGEGVLDAVRRVARAGDGALSAEFEKVVTAVGAGIPLAEALREMADGLRHPALGRCVDQVTGALDRGTPLAEVLRAQASDVRNEAKRELLEAAGRRELAMLFPLVFLILPITIIFAIFRASSCCRPDSDHDRKDERP